MDKNKLVSGPSIKCNICGVKFSTFGDNIRAMNTHYSISPNCRKEFNKNPIYKK